MKKLFLALAAVALPVLAQDYPQVPQSLVRYFSLTTEQASAIRTLNMAMSDYYDAAMERWDAVDDEVSAELEKDAPDPVVVGRGTVEMVMIDRDVEREARAAVEKVQAVLTPEQKEKLKVLQDALGLSNTIYSAASWLLLAPPESSSGSGILLTDGIQRTARKAKLARLLTGAKTLRAR